MELIIFILLYTINLFISFKFFTPLNVRLINHRLWKNVYTIILLIIYLTPSILYFFKDADSKSYTSINIIICILLFYFMSDLVSCFLHYMGDNIRIGKVNDFFIKHHDDPKEMIEYTNYNCLIKGFSAFFVSTILYYLYVKDKKRTIFSDTRFLIFIYLFHFELIHKFSHCRNHNVKLPYIVEKFQDFKIFLNPQDHRNHHENETLDYSLLNGSTNSLFNLFTPYFDKIIEALNVKI
jgi:hypothetical protein